MAKYSGGPSEDVLDEFFSLHPSYAECLKFFLGIYCYCFFLFLVFTNCRFVENMMTSSNERQRFDHRPFVTRKVFVSNDASSS